MAAVVLQTIGKCKDSLEKFLVSLLNADGSARVHSEGLQATSALSRSQSLLHSHTENAQPESGLDTINTLLLKIDSRLSNLRVDQSAAFLQSELKDLRSKIQFIESSIDSWTKTPGPATRQQQAESSYSAIARQQKRDFDFFKEKIRSKTFLHQRRATFPVAQAAIPFTPLAIDFSQLEFLWERLPWLKQMPRGGFDWSESKKDDVVFQPDQVRAAERMLEAFCDAWLELTEISFSDDSDGAAGIEHNEGKASRSSAFALVNPQRFAHFRAMAKIILTLSIMKNGRRHLNRFVEYNKSFFPFGDHDEVKCILLNNEETKVFMSQQYRVTTRNWPTGSHIQCHTYEPLRLEVGEELGSSAFGKVHKVKDIEDGEEYARKTQRSSQQNKEMFVNEINALKRLYDGSDEHHIVKFVKSYQRGDELGCLVKPAATKSLTGLLQHYCNLRYDDRKPLAITILRSFGCLSFGLRYMHTEAEMRHRDIKPDNLLYNKRKRDDETDEFLWTDFGVSHLFPPHGESTTSRAKTVCTPEYAAPETFREVAHGRKSDIFSFGCTFLEIANTLIVEALDHDNPACCLQYQIYAEHLPEVHAWVRARIKDMKDRASDKKYLRDVLLLAEWMMAEIPDRRPDIHQVIKDLLAIEEAWLKTHPSTGHDHQRRLFCNTCRNKLKADRAEQTQSTSVRAQSKRPKFYKGIFGDRG